MKNPLSKTKLNELFKKNNHGDVYKNESTILEFKEDFDWNVKRNRHKYLKTIAAFANRDGGYLIFGISDSPRKFKGMTKNFEAIDNYQISELINRFLSPSVDFEKTSFENNGKNFGILYIFKAKKKPVVCVKDYDDILKDSCIYYRYNSLSCEIKSRELIDLINIEKENESRKWMELFSKISTVGVDNTAIYNKFSGELTTNNGNRFILNEDLIQRLKIIDKYSIQDEGAEAVKIIGEIDSQGTIIKQPLAINENEILVSYLNSDNITAPESYLEACCYTNTKYLPIYFFILKAGLSKSQAKNLFSKVNSRSKVKKELQDRIENDSEFKNKYFPVSKNTSVQRKRLEFQNSIKHENDFEITNEGEIKRFLESIYSLKNKDYNTQFVKDIFLDILKNHTQLINGNLGSLFRSTIAFMDVIENKDLIDD
mgnify:CR=1 FL=1